MGLKFTPLPELARAIAVHRQSSIVLLEVERKGNVLVCTDVASLQEDAGREAVLTAVAVALRAMVERVDAELAAERSQRGG